MAMAMAAALTLAPASRAQDFELRHNVVLRSAVETGGDVQIAEILYSPDIAADLPLGMRMKLSGRLRVDVADELEPGDPGAQADFRSPWNRRVFVGDVADLELRDAYVDLPAGDWFLRLGKQQVVWGQADGLRVLDQVNPLSFREFILPEFEDRRIPLWMVNAERPVGDAMLQLLWIPDHSYDEVPREGVFAPTSPRLVPALPAGAGGEPGGVPRAIRPDRLFVDDDYGVRLSGFSGGWDWSLNALYAYGDQPVFAFSGAPSAAPPLQYERTAFVGGVVSNAVGKTVLRGELGYRTETDSLAIPSLPDGTIDRGGEVGGVLGLDYSPGSDSFLSGQIFVSSLMGGSEPLARERTELTTTLLLRRSFWNRTVTAESLWLHHTQEQDGLFQASISWQATSRLSAAIGTDFFYGNQDGLFGQFSEADRVFVSVERSF
jgi:hypothetical protein